MGFLQRIVNAVKSGAMASPKTGRTILPRAEDSLRDYPGTGLTPSRLAAILREADDGSLSTAMQLYEEMEEKDAHLFAVANTRRLALTGLEWEIVSAAAVRDIPERQLGDQAADYCRQTLTTIDTFDEALQHLALALGRNLSVAEIVWDITSAGLQPVQFVPVDFVRLIFDELNQLRILTDSAPREGINPPPHKFIIHTPHNVSGHPQRGGLLRVTAMAFLAKSLSFKDWLIYAEIFGMPVRIGRYEPTATPEEKRELMTMLDSLGSHAAGIFSRAVELEIVEAGRGQFESPYERLIEFLNREISKAWLGQTLTTDISGQRGALAATQVHNEVRQDILADDIRKEARTVRRDLLTPMTRLQFGPDAPIPYFRRRTRRADAAKELSSLLDVAVNDLGLSVPAAWAHDMLGIPAMTDQPDKVPGAPLQRQINFQAPQGASHASPRRQPWDCER